MHAPHLSGTYDVVAAIYHGTILLLTPTLLSKFIYIFSNLQISYRDPQPQVVEITHIYLI